MTWLRSKLRQWLGIDSDTAAVVDLVAGVEKSVMNRCDETQSYCVGRLDSAAKRLDSANLDLAAHNTRLLELRDALIKLETKPAAPPAEPEAAEPAGSWTIVKNRASRGQDAA